MTADRTRHAALRAMTLVCLVLAGIALAGRARAVVTLVPKESSWRYLATDVAADSTWKNVLFDDTSWLTGTGVFGYGEIYITTPVPFGGDPDNRYMTTYFRTTFTLAEDPMTVTNLRLSANYDDGYVAYLNGVEIARRGFGPGPIDYTTAAGLHEGGSYEPVNVSAFIGSLVMGTNVLAVEVHQAFPSSDDLVMDMDLQHSVTPSLARVPYLQLGTPTSVRVRWRTDFATLSRARLGPDPGTLPTLAEDATPKLEHEVEFTGLSPDTRYYYSVESGDGGLAGPGTAYTFVTTPISAKPTRVWVLGDAGTANLDQQQVSDGYAAFTGERGTDVWLMLGDNAYPLGTDTDYQNGLFNVYPSTLRTNVAWPTRGNHDLVFGGPGNDYYDFFTLPAAAEAGGVPSGTEAYYSFDYGNVHFVCLDSEGSNRSVGGAMAVWLRADLEATSKDWIIAYWHHPPYTKGSHDSDIEFDSGARMGEMRRNIVPVLDSAGVDLVLTGHSHSYERSFLLNGHYGTSPTLTTEMMVDSGNGRPSEDGAYVKATLGKGPFEGAIYAVAGSSGQISGGTLDHPVMVVSLNALGSMVLDIDGNRLDGRFVVTAGAPLDSFVIYKGVPLATGESAARTRFDLLPAAPNPSGGETRLTYTLERAGRVRLSIVDPAGRRLAVLADGARDPGRHETTWKGTDTAGRRLPPGVYYGVLELAGERRTTKIVRRR